MIRLPRRLSLALPALLLAALLLPACGSSAPRQVQAAGADLSVARDHAYTRLVAVRFGDDIGAAGFLVEFGELPDGIQDERPYTPGTVLVQDPDLTSLGFITPGGRGFRYAADGSAVELGYGKRDAHVTTLLGGEGRIRYEVVSPR